MSENSDAQSELNRLHGRIDALVDALRNSEIDKQMAVVQLQCMVMMNIELSSSACQQQLGQKSDTISILQKDRNMLLAENRRLTQQIAEV